MTCPECKAICRVIAPTVKGDDLYWCERCGTIHGKDVITLVPHLTRMVGMMVDNMMQQYRSRLEEGQ